MRWGAKRFWIEGFRLRIVVFEKGVDKAYEWVGVYGGATGCYSVVRIGDGLLRGTTPLY